MSRDNSDGASMGFRSHEEFEAWRMANRKVTHESEVEKLKQDCRNYLHEVEQLKAQLKEAKLVGAVALMYSPSIYICAHCGYPVASGYCCTSCNSANPRGDK